MSKARRQGAVLVIAGGVAGLAALFAPAERWGGVDLGATGAALFVLALVAVIVLVARRAPELFPAQASVAEQRAWIGLVFIGWILLSFARFMWAMAQGSEPPQTLDQLYASHFMQRLFILIVAWEILSYLVGRRGDGVELDERDLRLKYSAARVADVALKATLIVCICVLALVPTALIGWWLAPIVLANLLIGVLIGRSVIEHAVLTGSYFLARR
jgi:hypothetical protein